MRIFRTTTGIALEHDSRWFALPDTSWDAVVNRDDLHDYLLSATEYTETRPAPPDADLLPPIESQEVWAAGVTYFRSRTARMEEAKTAGGGDFYDRVYVADRPELFFKATPHRVRGHGQDVRIRSDASLERARARAHPRGHVLRAHRRLHHRQRHELARHRGREPAVSAAGQGLRRHRAASGPAFCVTHRAARHRTRRLRCASGAPAPRPSRGRRRWPR